MNSVIAFYNTIQFREPLWLLLSFQPMILLLLHRFTTTSHDLKYAQSRLLPWVKVPVHTNKSMLLGKNTLYLIAWILLSVSISGPRMIDKTVSQQTGADTTLMLVVDISRSMKTTDIQPNRIRRTQTEIYELLSLLKNTRVGIVVYAARAHLHVPATSDFKALRFYLSKLDQLVLPTMGSNHYNALEFTDRLFSKNKTNTSNAIILLTDGDVLQNSIDISKISFDHISTPVFVLGMGTIEGDTIPNQDGSWLQHNKQPVISRLGEDFLKQIAHSTGGIYQQVQDDQSDWQSLYQRGILGLGDSTTKDNDNIVWRELYLWSLLPALLLLSISLSPYKILIGRHSTANIFVFIMLLHLAVPCENAIADDEIKISTSEKVAHRYFMRGDYDTASEHYKTLPGFRGRFGEGLSHYRIGAYEQAVQQFSFAVLEATGDHQRAIALYNLGNSQFRTGNFSAAVQSYTDSLKYEPENTLSTHNLNISHKLDALVKQNIKQQREIQQAIKQGRGPRSASTTDDTQVTENTTVSIDGSEQQENDVALPELPEISNATLTKLLATGLQNIKLAEEGSVGNSLKSYSVDNLKMISANQHMQKMHDQQAQLWKRIFEIEEGFPAPVSEPHSVPGILPW